MTESRIGQRFGRLVVLSESLKFHPWATRKEQTHNRRPMSEWRNRSTRASAESETNRG
jgi:hypothetical protein